MATGVQVWSQTAATNATADSNVNWAEGMAPSAVNDSARAEMSSVAKWRDDNNSSLVTSGSSSAFTLATNQVATALTSGYTVRFQFHASADTSATLNVDGLGAKPIQIFPGRNLLGNEYMGASRGSFVYTSTGTGQWLQIDTPSHPYLTNSTTADIGLSTSFITGPLINQPTAGTWFVSGEVLLQNTTTSTNIVFSAKLWDGTNTYASASSHAYTNDYVSIHLSALAVNPVNSISITALANVSGGTMRFGNNVNNASASTISAFRIG